MTKQPDQQIHDELMKRASQLGLKAYPFLPEEGTKYPFMVVAFTQIIPNPNKSALVGELACQVDVWGDKSNRKLVSDWVGKLMNEYSRITRIENTTWLMDLNSTSQILKDNSTNELLYHGILDLTFTFF